MATMVEQIVLTCSSVTQNNNKVWVGELYDNGDVITRWGRITGDLSSNFDALESKTFPGAGADFLHKREREKLRPKSDKESYTRVPTVRANGNGKPVVTQVDNLQDVAQRQLAKSHPELSKVVDRLVKANVHNIVSQTSITFNTSTGLFQTPLGPVTKEGIEQARDILVEVKKAMVKKQKDKLPPLASSYLRIIPHDFGMRKLSVDLVFPDLDAVQKESGILDSLEATLATMAKAPVSQGDSKAVEPEKIFEVDFDILTDPAEERRLGDFYSKSMKSVHGLDHVKIRQMFKVRMAEMDRVFNRTLGNITEVFHGTSQANILSILKSGLKTSPPNTAYIAGKMFGNGIYGAINASKSLNYTFGYWGGSASEDKTGWLFICDFAMGKIYEPTGTCSRPADGHDSVWAKSGKTRLYHDELIVYRDNQVNIKYLLECK